MLKYSEEQFFGLGCHLLGKKDENRFVRHPSGNDRDYTIFDALLENLNKNKDKEPSFHRFLNQLRSPWNLTIIVLSLFGWITLAWVGQIIWVDLTFWGKDFLTIIFGSRIGEAISLGIGMKLIYYLVLGLSVIFVSLAIGVAKRKF